MLVGGFVGEGDGGEGVVGGGVGGCITTAVGVEGVVLLLGYEKGGLEGLGGREQVEGMEGGEKGGEFVRGF